MRNFNMNESISEYTLKLNQKLRKLIKLNYTDNESIFDNTKQRVK